MSPNNGWGGGGMGSQPMSTVLHDGSQIYFEDIFTPYLTYVGTPHFVIFYG
jgi:hypothetical protein